MDDPAGLPVLMALATFFFLVATPVDNTITRTMEAQADLFGVNASRQPDGFADAALHLSEYRKLDPSRSRSSCSTTTLPAAAASR